VVHVFVLWMYVKQMLLANVPSVVPPHTIGLELLSKPAIALAWGAGKSASLT